MIRTTSGAFGDWLDEALRAYRVRGRRDDRATYSVALDGGEEGTALRGRRFHLLYRGAGVLLRTMNLSTLGRGLLAEVARPACQEREDAPFLDGTLVAGPDRAVLLPGWTLQLLDRLGRRPARAGVALPVASWVAVDPGTGALHPPPPLLEVPGGAVDRLAALDGSGNAVDRVPLERPVRADVVFTYARDADGARPVTRGLALHRLAAAILNLRAVGGTGIEAVAGVVGAARCFEFGLPGRPQLLLDDVVSVLGGGRSGRERRLDRSG